MGIAPAVRVPGGNQVDGLPPAQHILWPDWSYHYELLDVRTSAQLIRIEGENGQRVSMQKSVHFSKVSILIERGYIFLKK